MIKTENETTISDAEWEVMRIVWTLGQAGSSQIIDQLQVKNNWTESTIKTLLRRLCQKGYLKTEKDGRKFLYSATVDQTTMMYKETKAMLNKMCDMHKGQLLIKLMKDMPISKTDLKILNEEIIAKEKSAPDKINCNCLPEMDC